MNDHVLFNAENEIPGGARSHHGCGQGFQDRAVPACPLAADQPAHLVRLAELLSAERTLADEECHECADDAWKKLVQLYQEFKLADSPETARLLIRQVEEQRAQQGRRIEGRDR